MHNHIRPKTRRVGPTTACSAAGYGIQASLAAVIEVLEEFLEPSLAAIEISIRSLHCIANGHKPALQPNPQVGAEVAGGQAALSGHQPVGQGVGSRHQPLARVFGNLEYRARPAAHDYLAPGKIYRYGNPGICLYRMQKSIHHIIGQPGQHNASLYHLIIENITESGRDHGPESTVDQRPCCLRAGLRNPGVRA